MVTSMSDNRPAQFERKIDRLERLWTWANAHPDQMAADPERRRKLAEVEAEYMVARDYLLRTMRNGREFPLQWCRPVAAEIEVSEETVRAVLRRLGREKLIQYDSCWHEGHGSVHWYVMPASVIAELAERERLLSYGESDCGTDGPIFGSAVYGDRFDREGSYAALDRQGVGVGS